MRNTPIYIFVFILILTISSFISLDYHYKVFKNKLYYLSNLHLKVRNYIHFGFNSNNKKLFHKKTKIEPSNNTLILTLKDVKKQDLQNFSNQILNKNIIVKELYLDNNKIEITIKK